MIVSFPLPPLDECTISPIIAINIKFAYKFNLFSKLQNFVDAFSHRVDVHHVVPVSIWDFHNQRDSKNKFKSEREFFLGQIEKASMSVALGVNWCLYQVGNNRNIH